MNPSLHPQSVIPPAPVTNPQAARQIAVAVKDGLLSRHFGKAEAFAIFRPSNAECGSPVFRPRDSQCGGKHHGTPHGKGEHRSILRLLEGCDVVLCGGLGHPIAEALRAHGILPFATDAHGTPDEICRRFLRGELPASATPACHSHCES